MKLQLITFAAFAAVLAGCSAPAKKLDQKVNQEPPIQTNAQLQAQTEDLIENSPDLTATQKSSLHALRETTRQQLSDLQKESLKLRAVLIRDVLNPKYNAREVSMIKDRIEKNERKKLVVMFNTVDEANRVLGREKKITNDDLIMFDLVGPYKLHDEF